MQATINRCKYLSVRIAGADETLILAFLPRRHSVTKEITTSAKEMDCDVERVVVAFMIGIVTGISMYVWLPASTGLVCSWIPAALANVAFPRHANAVDVYVQGIARGSENVGLPVFTACVYSGTIMTLQVVKVFRERR